MRWFLLATAFSLSSFSSLLCQTALSEDNRSLQNISVEKNIQNQIDGWKKASIRLTKEISDSPESVDLYSQRGDVRFFLGQFSLAVEDYEKMVELQPGLNDSHWRKGIALFYAKKYKAAAAQFDRYHSFDNVDRENGIWRYFSHFRAAGKKQARQELLKYEKDDREPFPSVYKLFAGQIEPEQIIQSIEQTKLPTAEREKRLFYADLYIGLNHALEGNEKAARKSLEKMLENTWGPAAGYGPHYMWQVGRLHLNLLQGPGPQTDQPRKPATPSNP